MIRNISSIRLLIAVTAAIAIAAGTYAFTAANTVPKSTAGAGSAGVSGYTITSLHFVLNASAPQVIDSATFTISPVIPSASTGKVIIEIAQGGAPAHYTCTTDAAGATVTCLTSTPVVNAADLTTVTIVAAQ